MRKGQSYLKLVMFQVKILFSHKLWKTEDLSFITIQNIGF